MFIVKNKNTRMTSLTFEQVNVSWNYNNENDNNEKVMEKTYMSKDAAIEGVL